MRNNELVRIGIGNEKYVRNTNMRLAFGGKQSNVLISRNVALLCRLRKGLFDAC